MPAPIQFGRYDLHERLAVGGMAELFVARMRGEAGFQKVCVIKRVLSHLTHREEFLHMFLDEARLAARLQHPGIVQIFDLGRVGDDYFIAMEYLVGEDLSAVLRKAKSEGRLLPVEVSAKIVALAAEALHYAHEFRDEDGTPLRIVHRDISPSNLFLTLHGTVKVLDFGIARAESSAHYTRTGEVRGKLAYMAPEQLRSEPVDRRADVWALGVVLYELLTGLRPFRGMGAGAEVQSVLFDRLARPQELNPGLPPALCEIALRCLERDPAARYESAEALRRALEEFVSERTYVPHTDLLSTLMRQLFGDAHLERAARRASLPAPQQEKAKTQSLPGAPPDEPSTITDQAQVPARSKRWWLAGAAIALAIVVFGGAAMVRSATAEAPPPAVVPGAVPAMTTAPAPPAPTEPTPSVVVEPPAPAPEPARTGQAAALGRLSVVSTLPATVWLGRKQLGKAPVRDLRLKPGRYTLRLVNASLGARLDAEVTVHAGRETAFEAKFRKGHLTVLVEPWADVFLNGAAVGQTPLAGLAVWEGEHRLRLVGPGGEKTLKVAVTANEKRIVRETLP